MNHLDVDVCPSTLIGFCHLHFSSPSFILHAEGALKPKIAVQLQFCTK
jgi:hypothetical protein